MYSSERLKGIDVFVAVAEAGSFTAAAQRLHLTSSAVGKAVARLEERLGLRLFARTTRRLAMTEAGEAFYQTCTQVLGALEEAEQVLRSEGTTPVGRLRIDLPASYGALKVMPALFEFLARFEGITPQISFTDRYVDLAEEGVDVAVRIGGSDRWPSTLGYRYLGHEQRIFCCSPAFLARHGPIVDRVDALDALPAVMYRRADGTPSPWFIAPDSGPVQHVLPADRLEIGHAGSVVEAVVRGLGVAQLSTWLIEAPLARGELVQIVPSFSIPGLPLYLLWLRSRQLLPKVDALVTHLAASLRV